MGEACNICVGGIQRRAWQHGSRAWHAEKTVQQNGEVSCSAAANTGKLPGYLLVAFDNRARLLSGCGLVSALLLLAMWWAVTAGEPGFP